MRKRFNLLPTYHFEENTDGQIRGATERVLRDCTIYGNCGKNLLPYPFKYTTKTINGITFTDNGDGTVTANGTATATAQFFPKESLDGPLLAPGTYTFSGCPKGGDWKIYNIRLTGFTADRDFGNGSTFTLTQATRVGMSLTISSGVTVENLVFKPQIESGSTKTDYEPYKEVGDLDAESGKYILPVTVSTTDYEPYTAPKITNLLLDAPLGPGESISCREKGLSVPELATIDPNITNYIDFGSEVKPSSAKFDYYKY